MPTMTPVPTQIDSIAVIGQQIRTSNAREMDPDTAQISRLWTHVYTDNLFGQIPHLLGDMTPIAVYTDYESDHRGDYALVVSGGVAKIDTVPQSLTALTIPAGRYLVFTANGTLPQAVIDAWGQIWAYFEGEAPYTRLYTCDFEHYRSENSVDIYIAIAP